MQSRASRSDVSRAPLRIRLIGMTLSMLAGLTAAVLLTRGLPWAG
jgi:hypothetical protein